MRLSKEACVFRAGPHQGKENEGLLTVCAGVVNSGVLIFGGPGSEARVTSERLYAAS
jgi:hypothetical protein